MKKHLGKSNKNKGLNSHPIQKKTNQENGFNDNSDEAIQMMQLQSDIANSNEIENGMDFEQKANDNESLAQTNQKENNTGLPNDLKAGIENLSGYSLDDVKVHYNSEKPAQIGALAYAQGSDIYIASGQEQHLPHELAHIVQQKEAKVQPTTETADGTPVNDDTRLENEADKMGEMLVNNDDSASENTNLKAKKVDKGTPQRKVIQKEEEATGPENTGELAGTLQQLGTSYVEWVMENCIIPGDDTFLYIKRIGMDPFKCADLYSKANPPTDTLQVVAGQVAENTQWIKTATKVMSAICIVAGAVNFGTAAAAGAGAIDLLLGSKFILDAANFVTFNFVVNSEYDEFEDWLRFHLSYKRSIMREWAAAEGIELKEPLIKTLQEGFKK